MNARTGQNNKMMQMNDCGCMSMDMCGIMDGLRVRLII